MIETELRRAFRSRGMLVVVLVAVILAADGQALCGDTENDVGTA